MTCANSGVNSLSLTLEGRRLWCTGDGRETHVIFQMGGDRLLGQNGEEEREKP